MGMLTEKEVENLINAVINADIDFEHEILMILAKIKEQNLMEDLENFQKHVVNYIWREWGDEDISEEDMAFVIVSVAANDESFKKIQTAISEKSCFYLTTMVYMAMMECKNSK